MVASHYVVDTDKYTIYTNNVVKGLLQSPAEFTQLWFWSARRMTPPFLNVKLARPRSYILFLGHSWCDKSNLHVPARSSLNYKGFQLADFAKTLSLLSYSLFSFSHGQVGHLQFIEIAMWQFRLTTPCWQTR